jgi:2-oxoglutarate ferredoxin oxidoreductase subunit beta
LLRFKRFKQQLPINLSVTKQLRPFITSTMTTLSELTTPYFPSFCPGCGDIAIWAAIKNAAVANGWDNTNSVLVAGIGCHGHMINFIKLTSFEGLHGRAIPVATGIKLVQPQLNVMVLTGDGDMLAEGGNHLIHACRRNHDLTIILFDNGIYGLTTGQTSPVSPHGFQTKSTPRGNPDYPLHPLTIAVAAGATFAARTYTGDIAGTAAMITKAVEHKGLAIVDILQPCVTFNKEFTHEYYQENTYKLGGDYHPEDKAAAFAKTLEWGPKQIPLGILYQEDRPSYEEETSIADHPFPIPLVQKRDVTGLYKRYT